MLKLAYDLGCWEALIKLGATVVMKELTPAQKAYMQRLTEYGAPTAAVAPQLRKAQREFKHFSQTQIPELIGASEAYSLPGGKMTAEGVRRSKEQGRILDEWFKSRGQMATTAPGVSLTSAMPSEAGTRAATPQSLKRVASGAAPASALGTANTVRALPETLRMPGGTAAATAATERASPNLLRRLGTAVTRRFAHV